MNIREFSKQIGDCTFVINKPSQVGKWLLSYWIQNRGHYYFDFEDTPEKCATLLSGKSLTKSMSDLKNRIAISIPNEIGELCNWQRVFEIELS